MMRVLLADDQLAVRSALRLLLDQMPGWQVAAEAGDATALLQQVEREGPDLVFLDWELPGLPPRQLLRLLRYERPSLKIIAMSSRPESLQAAGQLAVEGVLNKNEAPERTVIIIDKIRHALEQMLWAAGDPLDPNSGQSDA